MIEFPPFLPLIDPDHFSEIEFYHQLEEIGVGTILCGGTGSGGLRDVIALIRNETGLKVILYPAGPDSICEVDLCLLPDVMNSNSHYARPFGSGAVATALNIAKQGVPYLPVAYFILGHSTARWYYDAFLISSLKIIVGYCVYAKMIGYSHIALDYEDPALQIDPELVTRIKAATDLHITVSDEVSATEARQLLEHGCDTVVIPSDLFEESEDPIELARTYLDATRGSH